uniref:Uncharacterized protein n=1 Tax=Cyprinus carpio TaxID=7962 RepID=A0A8C2AQV1_CYPCA
MQKPERDERKACWGARDQLWKCLDEHREQTPVCEKHQREFEAMCPAPCRDFLKYKEKIQNQAMSQIREHQNDSHGRK